MNLDTVTTENVQVGPRMRQLDKARVAVLMESMKAIGLQQPITCWLDESDVPHLVAGAHRLAAARKLLDAGDERWALIPCLFVNLTAIDRRRWEIAENLHRADLTALQHDEHVAEWVRLTDEAQKVAQPAPVSKPKGGRGNPGGMRAATRELGVERTQAQRAIKVDGLSPTAKAVAREMGLDDNRSALLDAAKHREPDEQVAELRRKANARASRKAQTHAEIKDASADACEIIADAIAEFIPEHRLPAVTAALALRGLKDVAARVQSLTGAVFDKTTAGRDDRARALS